jgi:hypothetical protein
MTKFKLLAMATILSAVVATPGIAQQAVQEPGSQAFYRSLGVGSSASGVANDMASLRTQGSYASAPVKHITRVLAKHQ